MNTITFENAQVGKVYITQGGVVEDSHGNEVPWGYERVKLICKNVQTHSYIFKTPWGTELEVDGDYILYDTFEDTIYSVHNMIGLHERHTLQYIPLEIAVNSGITVLKNNEIISKSTRELIVEYFSELRSIADASKYFNMSYQQMRNHINFIKKHEINGIRYKIVENNQKNRKMIQFIQEKEK